VLFFALLGGCSGSIRPRGLPESGNFRRDAGIYRLTVLVFLLLLLLLMLLLRNILKLYVGQTSSALGARLRTRMVLGRC